MLSKNNINEHLFYLRGKYRKTQQEVADGSGVSRMSISNIEKQRTQAENLRADTFSKLNDYFKSLGEKENAERQLDTNQ